MEINSKENLFYFILRFYLFLEEAKGRRKRRRETSVCACLLRAPYQGPGLQPRHVPWLGIELATLWFAGWHSVYWVIPARAGLLKRYIVSCHLQIMRVLFLPLWIGWFLFPCLVLISVARTSNTMLTRSGDSGHPCLVLNLRENTSSFSPLRVMLTWFATYGLSYVEICFSIPTLLRIFS